MRLTAHEVYRVMNGLWSCIFIQSLYYHEQYRLRLCISMYGIISISFVQGLCLFYDDYKSLPVLLSRGGIKTLVCSRDKEHGTMIS
jgi:hypothetical protein